MNAASGINLAQLRTYSVSPRAKQPLCSFVLDALEGSGCRILNCTDPGVVPFQITFETAFGERMGIVAYAFLANARVTKNRPSDEHRFQIKYGKKDGEFHEIWQDPFELYTTLLLGIDPESGFFVGIDPVLHNPTRMFISFEFKENEVASILQKGWHFWERQKTSKGFDSPVETVVGGRASRFLDYVRFEQAALGLDQGHRYLLAEQLGKHGERVFKKLEQSKVSNAVSERHELHKLAKEFELDTGQILSMIDSAPRLKMAVRGWVAETHLEAELKTLDCLARVERLEEDGQPDFDVELNDGTRLRIECKNVLRKKMADGTVRVDFQKTRASKSDPCSRYYASSDFQVLAACLHPATEKWEFRYQLTSSLAAHDRCPGKLDNKVRLGENWYPSFDALLSAV